MMTWTTELPTKMGFYWMWDVAENENEIVHIRHGHVHLPGLEGSDPTNRYEGCRWYGPLEPPE